VALVIWAVALLTVLYGTVLCTVCTVRLALSCHLAEKGKYECGYYLLYGVLLVLCCTVLYCTVLYYTSSSSVLVCEIFSVPCNHSPPPSKNNPKLTVRLLCQLVLPHARR
jgi:hypothetical protein